MSDFPVARMEEKNAEAFSRLRLLRRHQTCSYKIDSDHRSAFLPTAKTEGCVAAPFKKENRVPHGSELIVCHMKRAQMAGKILAPHE